ncbi:MAG: molybdopterin cofactor-binding domain-containing protein [Novosphingobium sp.]
METRSMELEVVGMRVANVDALDKVTGGRGFPMNVTMPGMLHGRMLRSPYPHAQIVRIDASAARALPGVHAVLTPADVPQKVYSPVYFVPTLAVGSVQDMLLLDTRIRSVGQVVAAVAATTPEIAEAALDLIEVEYEELPAVFTIDEAIADAAPQLHEGKPGNIAKHVVHQTGDIDAGFADADTIFEGVYETQRVHTCYMEGRVCVVSADREGNLTVHASMQHLFGLREKLAFILDIPESKIRVVKPPYIGGGFGGKLEVTPMEPLAALMSMQTGRPVRIEHSRREDFITTCRSPFRLHLKTGIKKDGTITARSCRSYLDCGGNATHGAKVLEVHGLFGFMYTYNCPNRYWEGTTIYTNNMISGGYRGYGAPQAAFAVEQQMDEMAEALGIDPIELRLRNLHQEGEKHPLFPSDFTTYRLDECLRRGAEAIGWRSRSGPGAGKGRKVRGIGLATTTTWTSCCAGQPDLYEHSGAIVKLNPDGSADIATAAIDLGCGQNTTYCQIVAEELGLPFDKVRMTYADTSTVPFDAPMHASRGTYAAGGAIKLAASNARTMLLRYAAGMLSADVEDLDIRDGRIFVRNTSDRFVTIQDVATLADSPIVKMTQQGPVPDGPQFRGTIIGTSSFAPEFSPIVGGAMFVEVEVDTDTGEVSVEHVVYAHDIGKVINPMGAEGQVEGGVQQGIGYALMENLVFDQSNGVCLAGDFLDYKMPTAVEMPKRIESIFVESIEDSGPFGAKSLSECALIAPAAAIANAVYNATGARIKSLPITPEKVLEAMGRL